MSDSKNSSKWTKYVEGVYEPIKVGSIDGKQKFATKICDKF